MKTSIITSVLILAIAGMIGWKGQQQLNLVRVEHRKAIEQAERLGVSIESGEGGASGRRLLERERRDRKAEIKEFVAEVIAFANRMKEAETSGEYGGEEMQKETMEMMRRFLDLDGTQLKGLIAELKDSEEIDDEMRQGIVGFAIMMLANESPETALALYAESADMLDMDGMGEHVVSSALSQLAAKDPFAALDWIRENGEANPDLVTEDTKAAVIAGAARQDATMALRLMDELDLKNSHQAVDGIARAADSPEKQLQLLETLRGLPTEDGESKRDVMRSLSSQVIKGGFDASVDWLEEADLDSAELGNFSEGLSYHQTQEDTGMWLEWIDEHVSGKKHEGNYAKLMGQWTRNDFQAAGNWLNDAAEGPGKAAAVVTYAKTVAPYEPESAAQWVGTLPEGKKRRNLAKVIHKEWKKKDEAAAAVFAVEQGIE